MTPPRSAPTAAPCWRACAAACRRPSSSPSARGRIAGFLLGRDGRVAAQVGPLIAEDDAVARALLGAPWTRSRGRCSSISRTPRARCAAVLEARGFAAQRPFTRMLYGRSQRYDDEARTFAVVGPEFG